MNRFAKTSIVISIGICGFGAALADDADAPRTRAEVIAERDAAAAAGLITAMAGEDSGSFHFSQQRWVSTRSRAEVVAEAVAARRSGELDALNGEDSGSVYLARAMNDRSSVHYVGPTPGHDEAALVRLAQVMSKQ